MPPGVSGLVDSGSGASRVHSTKPSGRGAPEATPKLNGLPARQLCAAAWRSKARGGDQRKTGARGAADEAAAIKAVWQDFVRHDGSRGLRLQFDNQYSRALL